MMQHVQPESWVAVEHTHMVCRPHVARKAGQKGQQQKTAMNLKNSRWPPSFLMIFYTPKYVRFDKYNVRFG